MGSQNLYLTPYALYLWKHPHLLFFGFTSSMRFGRGPLAVTFLSPEERNGPILANGFPRGKKCEQKSFREQLIVDQQRCFVEPRIR